MDKDTILSHDDLFLFGEGTNYKSYEKLGAHLAIINNQKGVHFAVWAPNATRVSVFGEFNGWKKDQYQLIQRETSGIWAGFIPGLKEWTLYKYAIETKFNGTFEKADPFAFCMEQRPKTASIVFDLNKLKWHDNKWLNNRKTTQSLESPIAIYEVHLGSWQRVEDPKYGWRYLSYEELGERLIPYVKEMGYTHIELMPITEHPFDQSWGYQTTGYFAPTTRYGTPEDFQKFVDKAHENNIGILLDWVPAHFPKDDFGLSYFDGTNLYEHADPRKGEHKDWGTKIFNYGRKEVQSFLLSSACFWAEKYHIDGFRVDAVASMLYLDYSRKEGEWLPNEFGGRENLEAIEFLKRFNIILHDQFPGILTVAEESTAWGGVSRPTYIGGLGFSLKWNMGWMHDTLEYFCKEPVHRRFHQDNLTFSLLYAFTENFILPFSHDEVVHGKGTILAKMPGDDWQKFANARLLYGYMYAHPGKKLLFMGSEFGQWREWNSNESLEWHLTQYPPHQGLSQLIKDLNQFYTTEPALYEDDFTFQGFEWIDFRDKDNSILAFIRFGKDHQGSYIVAVCNFTPVPRYDYRIGVSDFCYFKEVINTDSFVYGGSNLGNFGQIHSDEIPMHGRPYSLKLNLPPLATLILKKLPKV